MTARRTRDKFIADEAEVASWIFTPAAEVEAQDIIDAVEFLVEPALKHEEEFVEMPTQLAAAALLVMKGHLRRGRGKPHNRHKQRRRAMWKKLRPPKPVADPMIVWARERQRQIRAEFKAKRAAITAPAARAKAASEAKVRFESGLSEEQIADRMQRPGRFSG